MALWSGIAEKIPRLGAVAARWRLCYYHLRREDAGNRSRRPVATAGENDGQTGRRGGPGVLRRRLQDRPRRPLPVRAPLPGFEFLHLVRLFRVPRGRQRPARALWRRGLEPEQPASHARARVGRRADRDNRHRSLQPARRALRVHRQPHEHARGLRAADDRPAVEAGRLRRQEITGGVPDLRAPDALPQPDRGRPHQSSRRLEGGPRGRRRSGCKPGSRSSSSPRRRARRCSTPPPSTRSASSWRNGRRSR